ncbi:MAG: FAD-dependent oxidoreductase [Gammaproteobacteria bacterium]
MRMELSETREITTRCCIVGGGPAGMMLGLLLARAGVPVMVLEKHDDFLRDFRGDTVHPSTLQILDEIGLLAKFEQLPQHKVDHLSGIVSGREQQLVDFRGLRPYPYLALVPQWDLLDLLADEGRRYPQFDLRMHHEAVGLVEEAGRIVGVRVRTLGGALVVRADLVVACDGRHSVIRAAAGLHAQDYGAPMDVLWFRLSRQDSDPQDTFGIIGGGHMMVLLNRNDYWQAAYLVPKGGDGALRAQPIAMLQASIAQLASFLADRTTKLASWDQVKTLEVRVDRLEHWYLPGLLLIGDAAHAMSPVGGVGINLAIQDAVAAANALTPVLLGGGPVGEMPLRAVQQRRLRPTKWTQAVQLQIQRRVISPALSQSGRSTEIPVLLRWLLRFRVVRNIPARIFGYGFRRERVRFQDADAARGPR